MAWMRGILQYVLIVALQVLLFDHMHLAIWGFPMVYVLFLLNLSPRLPRWAELLVGAGVGLTMDIWYSSMGVHMAACVAVAFVRPILLSNIVQDIERITENVTGKAIGIAEYVKAAVILVIMHHFIVFTLEAWDLSQWWVILLQTIISSVMTLMIIIGYDRLKN